MNTKGAIIASAVATLFATALNAPAMAADKGTGGKVKCEGANGCKAKGACKSVANACSGKNGCKSKGFIFTQSEDECKAKGGTVAK